jgi:DNA-binding GntR family transcriptional regulator
MPATPRYSAAPVSKSSKAPAKPRVPPPTQVPLTAAKANAIKAALMAGVKANDIARQFGVSLGAIREAMAELKRK